MGRCRIPLFYHEGHEENEGLQDETFQAVFQDFHIKIDQEALFYFGEFHIREQLGIVNRFQLGHGLQFHDDGIFNEEIDSIAAIEMNPFIVDRERVFRFEGNAGQMKLTGQALLICGFQQTGAKMSMDFDGGTDDPMGQVCEFSFHHTKKGTDLFFSIFYHEGHEGVLGAGGWVLKARSETQL